MRFLHPQFLWLLPAAFLPAAIYFLVSPKAAKIYFSGLFLLERAQLQSLRRRRARTVIVLLLRSAALVCVILAVSGPVATGAFSGFLQSAGRRGAASVVVLVDESCSMRRISAGKRWFETAIEAGVSALNNLGSEDNVAVMAFSDKPRIVRKFTSPDKAALSLAELKPGFGGTDYSAAIAAGYGLLSEEKTAKKAILVLSDNSAHGGKVQIPAVEPGVIAAGLSAPPAENNRIEKINLEGAGLLDGAAKPRLVCEVRAAVPRLRAQLKISGVPAETQAAESKDGRAVFSWTLPKKPSGVFSGSVELEPDALAEDNERFFYYEIPAERPLLCLYEDGLFMRRGRAGNFLKSFAEAAGLKIDFAGLGTVSGLADYAGIILAGFSRLDENEARELENYALSGGRLLVIAEAGVPAEAFAPLENVLPAEIIGRSRSSGKLSAPKEQSLAPQFDWRGYETGDIAAENLVLAVPKPGAKTVWEISAGEAQYPALAGRQAGKGEVWLWTPGIETKSTNLALKPAFAVFMARAVSLLRGAELFPIPFARPASENYPPGIYSEEKNRFAANVDGGAAESDLSPLKNPPWEIINAQNAAVEFSARLGEGRAGPVFLIAALALLFAELLIANWKL